jgi:Flp pilus assembly pilin Flp
MVRKSFFGRLLRDRKGQGMVEYALMVAGIALVGILGVSLIGEKTGDMLDLVAIILPGSDSDDNGQIGQGHLIEDANVGGNIQLDVQGIAGNSGSSRLGLNLTGQAIGSGTSAPLIVDAVSQGSGS